MDALPGRRAGIGIMRGQHDMVHLEQRAGAWEGSTSKTSNAAPAIIPFSRAAIRATSSTTGPLEVLIKTALVRISPKVRAFIRWKLVGFKSVFKETKSERASNSSNR